MKIYDTMQRKKVQFESLEPKKAKIYSCGPTVYWRVHTGNLRAYVAFDVLSRALRYLGFDTKRVINFTDVGHMTGDEDFGEDKVDKQAKEEKIDPLLIANKYIVTVLRDFAKTNILHPNGEVIDPSIDVSKTTKEEWAELGWSRATDYIQEMIDIIKMIEKHGYTYETEQALYFDVTKYPDYTKLSRQSLNEKREAVREEVGFDSNKRNPADFVLWMKLKGRYKDHLMQWESPWGKGFPGWHIECTAMGNQILGEQIDIHTGGTDHICVHHTNEIAQNFGAFQHEVVKYWVHNEMLVNKEGDKLSKSKKNVYLLEEIEEMGFSPMDLRYYFLTVNYRLPMPFSVEGLQSAKNSRLNLLNRISEELPEGTVFDEYKVPEDLSAEASEYHKQFVLAIEDNLNTSKCLAIMVELLKSGLNTGEKMSLIKDFDKVLGLNLLEDAARVSAENKSIDMNELPKDIQEMITKRAEAKKDKNFQEADKLRDEILGRGYEILDTPGGISVKAVGK